MAFQPLMPCEKLWDGEMLGERGVLLLSLDGQICAYRDRCAHQGVPLSEGRLEGDQLVCRVHEWRYQALSGAGINPTSAQLERLPLRIEGGVIWVDV